MKAIYTICPDSLICKFPVFGCVISDFGIKLSSIVQVDVYVPIYLHYMLIINNEENSRDYNMIFLNEKHSEKMKISVDWWLTTMHDMPMPSQRKIDKKQISVWIPIVLFRKFQKRARELNMTMTEIITAYLIQQTQNINLTPEDYENIAREIRKKTNNN
ncbi:hypothetical protein [Akkermansia sp.]|uniref:hypothetical protein n=1 Tax=Akkermansia sp. TaxID=1872421 RepID=UPI0025BF1B47|nr:hypothetical protein [Akkermansia sp.]MCC8149726.1 hypothetical protein [Akkermansia sp.]